MKLLPNLVNSAKSSGDLIQLFNLFSVRKSYSFDHFCEVGELTELVSALLNTLPKLEHHVCRRLSRVT
jgi:hypothetical protein